ncbi:SAV_915 family protein [Streptomyces avicenniae]|uniref:SAV_915 family protein n=1 Tax=Streptomyces avicenniae TaxID=500153 RepID=UPI00069A10D6|nr:SAV_915 family protein [Streptomyces avicenniae]
MTHRTSPGEAAGDPEEADPCDGGPAGPLHVPVRPGPAGVTVRLFRDSLGARTAVAFTTQDRLVAVLGPWQQWVRLSEPALRALTAPLGAVALTLDPQLVAPAADRTPRRALTAA